MAFQDRKHKGNGFLMIRLKWIYLFGGLVILFIIWRLNSIEGISPKDCRYNTGFLPLKHGITGYCFFNYSDVDVEVAKRIISSYQNELQLTEKQLKILRNLGRNNNSAKIYAITPTYWRLVQKAELTRISQTLALVSNIHWIVIEDADEKTNLVTNLLAESGLQYTHLNAKTPPFEKLHKKMPRYTRHRGVEQRNAALKWLRENLHPEKDKGFVYFMDDDNTYSVKVFKEIEKVKKVGVWPVGLVGGLNAETPVLDPITGKVTSFKSGWRPDRTFAIDMAGFAISLDLILQKTEAVFAYTMQKGYQESAFLSFFIRRDELEPLADNCTKVYVWHTRTETPDVKDSAARFNICAKHGIWVILSTCWFIVFTMFDPLPVVITAVLIF